MDEEFIAEVTFRFTAPSLEQAGGAMNRLSDAAGQVGFEMEGATVQPAGLSEASTGWRGYAPLDVTLEAPADASDPPAE